MSAVLIPWPTHRRPALLLEGAFHHLRDCPPADAGAARDLLAVIGAVRSLVESDPALARKIDAEFRRLRHPPVG